LVTLASTVGSPTAIRVGKVRREPPPAIALTTPAAMPAATSRTISEAPMTTPTYG
jgi:hypothetical protein